MQEFDISKIANDAHIALPQELFGPDAMHQLADINDLAIKDYQSFIAQGHTSSEALQLLQEKDAVEATVLKLSYFDDSKLPTEAELAPLFKELDTTMSYLPVAQRLLIVACHQDQKLFPPQKFMKLSSRPSIPIRLSITSARLIH